MAPPASAATFSADAGSLGAIPDDAPACFFSSGSPLDVTFAVSGVGPSLTRVEVGLTASHAWVGDLAASLSAPDGTTRHSIFSFTGSTGLVSPGDSSDLGGTYVFSDDATAPPHGGWWEAAAAQGEAGIIPPGVYRATDGAGAPTNITPTFAGLANPNGTWTLRLTDRCGGIAGSVTGATLTLESDVQAPVVTIGSGPAGPTTDTTPTFGFSANEPVTFACRVYATGGAPAAFGPCSGPGDAHTPTALADGDYTFDVRGTDPGTNIGSASRAFTVTAQECEKATADLAAAQVALDQAKQKLKKAKKKLKKAKKSGDPDKVKKAKKKVKKAKKAVAEAKAAVATAQAAVNRSCAP